MFVEAIPPRCDYMRNFNIILILQKYFEIDGGEPHLLVSYITNLTPLTCEIDKKNKFDYPNFLSTTTSKWNYVPIEIQDLVEKSVFFRSPGGLSHFFDIQILIIVLEI